jgi:5-methylcytosine-specific restriction protein A
MTYQIAGEDGSPLQALLDIDGADLIFHSRGGTIGKDVRNADYSQSLRLVLSRLASHKVPVLEGWVDSSQVQDIPLNDRQIFGAADQGASPSDAFRLLSSRMQQVGKAKDASKGGGNPTRKIRLRLPQGLSSEKFAEMVGAIPIEEANERLPVSELEKVTAEHIYHAVRKLLSGYEAHAFDASKDYDVVLEDGTRLAPKAVFGLAASEALGFEVLPKHFSAGLGTPCFRLLAASGYDVLPKESAGGDAKTEVTKLSWVDVDPEFAEGTPQLRRHLRRERSAGLREAKKAEFRRTHGGKLFCERCLMDPVVGFESVEGEACIEIHHDLVQVQDMAEGHVTKLEDVKCLCANCHRFVHRLLRKSLPDPQDK